MSVSGDVPHGVSATLIFGWMDLLCGMVTSMWGEPARSVLATWECDVDELHCRTRPPPLVGRDQSICAPFRTEATESARTGSPPLFFKTTTFVAVCLFLLLLVGYVVIGPADPASNVGGVLVLLGLGAPTTQIWTFQWHSLFSRRFLAHFIRYINRMFLDGKIIVAFYSAGKSNFFRVLSLATEKCQDMFSGRNHHRSCKEIQH